jgi:hypothetical protein
VSQPPHPGITDGRSQPGADPGAPIQLGTGWRGARRELSVAACLVLSVAAAAWAIDGPAAASLVVVISVAASLVLLHALVPGDKPGTAAGDAAVRPSDLLGPQQNRLSHSFTGFWRTQSDLTSATRSLGAWDYGTRIRLANLLAARLAERHGISMTQHPEAARQLLNAGSRHDLWYWIDPQRPTPPDAGTRTGIPPRVLAALIQRLERL